MCETSNRPAAVRTAWCSSTMPVYCTGMSHPVNGTIRAPAFTCRSWRDVLRRGCSLMGRCRLPWRAMATPWDRAAAKYIEEWVPRFVPYHVDLVRELALAQGQR